MVDFSSLMGGRYVQALCKRIGMNELTAQEFVSALSSGDRGRSAVLITEKSPYPDRVEGLELSREDWMMPGAYIIDSKVKVGSTQAYEQGWVYPLDLSSVWEMSALYQSGICTPRTISHFLDMCAAPGGKALMAYHLLRPQWMLANEVEASRLGILRHNVKRSISGAGFCTQRLLPRELAECGASSFQGIWVDAPCSGQSMLAKGTKNPGCFHPSMVKGNAKRQRGILASAAEMLAAGGFMGYSTCSFSYEENEGNVAWFLKKFPEFSTVEVPSFSLWRSGLSEAFTYRLMPYHGLGSGGFVTLFRKEGDFQGCDDVSDRLREYPL